MSVHVFLYFISLIKSELGEKWKGSLFCSIWLNNQLVCLSGWDKLLCSDQVKETWILPEVHWASQPANNSLSFRGIISASANERRNWPRKASFFLVSLHWGQTDTGLLMLAQAFSGSWFSWSGFGGVLWLFGWVFFFSLQAFDSNKLDEYHFGKQ